MVNKWPYRNGCCCCLSSLSISLTWCSCCSVPFLLFFFLWVFGIGEMALNQIRLSTNRTSMWRKFKNNEQASQAKPSQANSMNIILRFRNDKSNNQTTEYSTRSSLVIIINDLQFGISRWIDIIASRLSFFLLFLCSWIERIQLYHSHKNEMKWEKKTWN